MKKVIIVNETKLRLPKVAFDAIKDAALGKAYALNVIIASPARMKKLNTIYRDIEKPTDILSFPLSENEGEIYLCLPEARTEAKKFDRPYENFLSFLFIHGCVHLKGHDHGGTMEAIEAKLRTRFGI
jgi:probable rRNA maturation factor